MLLYSFEHRQVVYNWRPGMSRLTGRACLLKLSGTCLGEKILSDSFFLTLKEHLLVLVNLKFLFSIEVKLLQVNTE